MSIEYITLSAPLSKRLTLWTLQTLLPLTKPLRQWASRSPLRMRQALTLMTRATQQLDGVQITQERLGGRPTERVLAAQARHTVLYLHGGAYVAGGPHTHRSITTALAVASNSDVRVLDYRLAPEHPFPAALEDAVAAYRELLAQGIAADQIILAGDSAGGGLATALALQLREAQLPLPASLILLSPWLDLTHSGKERPGQPFDPMLNWPLLENAARYYIGNHSDGCQQPLVSPLEASFEGFPPVLIIVGTEEILLPDSLRLQQKLSDSHISCRCLVYPKMWHVFPALTGKIAEADHAIQAMAEWITTAVPQSDA